MNGGARFSTVLGFEIATSFSDEVQLESHGSASTHGTRCPNQTVHRFKRICAGPPRTMRVAGGAGRAGRERDGDFVSLADYAPGHG